MKKFIGIFLGLLASIAIIAQEQKRETEHFTANYSIEAEEYAIASLEVLEIAWTIATNNGYYLPKRIKFSIKKSRMASLLLLSTEYL